MKNTVLLFVLVAFFPLCGRAQTPPTANEILQEACLKAIKENKNVFVLFHASWCGWCHKMDKSMSDPVCKKFFDDNYIITHLVVDESKDKKALENPGANELRNKYYGDGMGIPFWLVLDKDGKLLYDSKIRAVGERPDKGENTGCPANEEEVAYFVKIIKSTSNLNAAQLEIISKRFRENE